MQTFAPPSEQMETLVPGSTDLVFVTVAPVDAAESDSVDSLRDALHAAELRLAYFERFGPWVEEQMAAVVERASSLECDSERVRSEASDEATRLRAEVAEEVARMRCDAELERQQVAAETDRWRQKLEDLKTECERQREEARAAVAKAHKTAEFVMGRLNQSADAIVQQARDDFETLRRELTPEALAATAISLPEPAESGASDDKPVPEEEPKRGWRPFVR